MSRGCGFVDALERLGTARALGAARPSGRAAPDRLGAGEKSEPPSTGHWADVRAAVDYYADFTKEVDQHRAEQRQFERRERERWERSERLLG